MSKPVKDDPDERTPAETDRLREATLKRLVNTPPKSHADMVKERRKVSGKEKPARARKTSR